MSDDSVTRYQLAVQHRLAELLRAGDPLRSAEYGAFMNVFPEYRSTMGDLRAAVLSCASYQDPVDGYGVELASHLHKAQCATCQTRYTASTMLS